MCPICNHTKQLAISKTVDGLQAGKNYLTVGVV